jgi:RNA polymerase sigma factor (TIGR02999 family)
MSLPDVTTLLRLARDGDPSALGRLLPVVYEDLLTLARRQRGDRGAADTLNTTALVHEAYERLAKNAGLILADRAHFFRVAGRAMRAVLVDYARAQSAAKRGGRARPLPLDAVADLADAGVRIDEVLAVNDALHQLEAFDERLAQVAECRYFAGLSVEETAGALGISEATVKRDWAVARAWLHRALTA